MKPIRPIDSLYSGFKTGLVYAFLGIVLFAIFLLFRQMIIKDPLLKDFVLDYFFPFIIFGFMFSFVPAGIGGAVLGLLLHKQKQKENLSLKTATKAGMLLGVIAALVICGSGILIIVFHPHNYWFILWNFHKEETFLDILSRYLQEIINYTSRIVPEILTTITIACLAGGLAGRYLAKKLLAIKTDISN